MEITQPSEVTGFFSALKWIMTKYFPLASVTFIMNELFGPCLYDTVFL